MRDARTDANDGSVPYDSDVPLSYGDPNFAGGSLVLSVYVNGADAGRRRDEGREPV